MNPKKINHIGIATADLDESIIWYRDILGLTCEGREKVTSEEVEVAFFYVGDVKIELLAPTADTSPIARFLAKHGPGVHHIAFEVTGIAARLAELADKGVRLINSEPKNGAFDMQIAFLHPKSTYGVLMELCEKQNK